MYVNGLSTDGERANVVLRKSAARRVVVDKLHTGVWRVLVNDYFVGDFDIREAADQCAVLLAEVLFRDSDQPVNANEAVGLVVKELNLAQEVFNAKFEGDLGQSVPVDEVEVELLDGDAASWVTAEVLVKWMGVAAILVEDGAVANISRRRGRS